MGHSGIEAASSQGASEERSRRRFPGGLSVSGQGTLRGTGVFFYFDTGCSVSFSGGATTDLSAPTTGTYDGILMFQARGNTAASSLTGGAGQITNGIMYFPDANLHYAGGSSSSTSSQSATIVAYNLTVDGNSYIQNSGNSPYLTSFSGFAMIE